MSRPRLRRWLARATPAAVEEMRAIRAAGEVLVPVRDGDRPLPRCDAELPAGAVIVRTSGSTGVPRDLVLPAEAFEASARACADRLDLRTDDVWWASLSPAHVGGIALLLRADHVGCGLELAGGFDGDTFWRLCADGRITHASLVPTMLRRILEAAPPGADPTGLRAILIGGAAADPQLLRRAIDAGLPVVTTWGMTETTSQLSTATPTATAADPTHSGRPLPGVEVRVAAGGRLEVRTPALALGELIEGALVPLTGADGWFATDDLGRIDDDGFVRITGRVSDRIISGGVNVDPLEVEREIRSLPWVVEVAVVGVPDPEWGERVTVVIVPDVGDARSPEELLAALPASLVGARRPKSVILVPTLPLNPNGKVDRAAIRRSLALRS